MRRPDTEDAVFAALKRTVRRRSRNALILLVCVLAAVPTIAVMLFVLDAIIEANLD